MKKKLAIVIPAYKADFFELALESIAKQTCKNFTLYIGDDASPNNLNLIVDKFRSEIDLFYVRFNKNFGGSDLVKQWERCIDLTQEEEWIWLFSDDDIMQEDCVEKFYNHIQLDKRSELLHFNTDIIDGKGNKYAAAKPFLRKMKSHYFFERRIAGEIFSFIIEYIFTRKLYLEKGKFQKFDLAWCTDDATWIKFSETSKITTICNETMVYWRLSGENISSLNMDKAILIRKLNAKVAYLYWALSFFKNSKVKINISIINKVKWVLHDLKHVSNVPLILRIKFAFDYARTTGGFLNGVLGVFYISYCEIKQSNKILK